MSTCTIVYKHTPLNTRTHVCTQEWTLIGELRSGLAAASCLDRVDRSREEVLWRPALTSGTYLLTSLLLATRCLTKFIQIRIMENVGIWVDSDIWTSFTTRKKHNQWLWSVRLTIFFEDPNCSVFTCDFLGHHCFHWNWLEDLTHHFSTIRIAIAHRVIFNYPSCFQCQKEKKTAAA